MSEVEVGKDAHVIVIWFTVGNFFETDGVEVDLIGARVEELCSCNDTVDDIVSR